MQIKGYTLVKKEELTDIHSVGYYFKHDKTGARISCIKNDDENKVFYIGFRTPSINSTGNAHILEHSVLCGSDKYPVKDPFVELAKGSLNTFLNAMTYPDKTVYPVASCNNKDFENLVDVYLDAVFHPAIYKHEEIFRQEGWHYELEDKDSPITINGVVYNEMKGAFSSPEDVLARINLNSTYPDTGYGFESGGDPEYIPDLSYEQFLDFHRTLYHPSNSYIYFYGDMDMEEKLRKLDEEYLSNYDYLEVDSKIKRQPAFDKMHVLEEEYAIAADESEEDNTYFSLNYSCGEITNYKEVAAMEIIDELLINSPAAPLRINLMKSGICKDVMGGYDAGTMQPSFTITAKNSNKKDAEEFLAIVKSTISNAINEGLDKTMIEGILTQNIFKAKEADTGRYPKGLLYGLGTLDTWLYDDDMPFDTLWEITIWEELLKENGTGYFEQLCKKYLLDNNHASFVTLSPKKGKATLDEEKLAKKLADYKSTLSEKEIEDLIKATSDLKEYQASGDAKEDLEKLPMLTRDDIKKEALPLSNIEIKEGDMISVYHDYDTNGIDYHSFYFEVTDYSAQELLTLALCLSAIGFMDTKKRSYGDVYNESNLRAGGMAIRITEFASSTDDSYRIFVNAKFKALYEKAKTSADLIKEVLLETDFSDKERFHQLVMEARSNMEMGQSQAGHQFASKRAAAGFSKLARLQEFYEGYELYKETCRIDDNFDELVDECFKSFEKIVERTFVKERMIAGFTCEKDKKDEIAKLSFDFMNSFPSGEKCGEMNPPEVKVITEGLYDASGVVYVCRAGEFMSKNLPYTGALSVLKVILSYDYLWINIRVQGGAYGCMSQFARSGKGILVSYRDPNLEKTNDVFEKTPGYLRNFDADDKDMTKYVIGCFGDLDAPKSANKKADRSMAAYFTNLTYEDIQTSRDEARCATAEDIRNLAPYIEAMLETGAMVVVGNEDKIKASDLLEVKEPLKQ
ncbi:MAG: insulinase family protein [Lachnospiraceae bacterium]|nr:insulinase family protein [Lachnospiraceae bacterium]